MVNLIEMFVVKNNKNGKYESKYLDPEVKQIFGEGFFVPKIIQLVL